MRTHPDDHECGADSCEIDWLFEPNGPSDPGWRERVRAAWNGTPSVYSYVMTQFRQRQREARRTA
jgi:hypothetical protein